MGSGTTLMATMLAGGILVGLARPNSVPAAQVDFDVLYLPFVQSLIVISFVVVPSIFSRALPWPVMCLFLPAHLCARVCDASAGGRECCGCAVCVYAHVSVVCL